MTKKSLTCLQPGWSLFSSKTPVTPQAVWEILSELFVPYKFDFILTNAIIILWSTFLDIYNFSIILSYSHCSYQWICVGECIIWQVSSIKTHFPEAK